MSGWCNPSEKRSEQNMNYYMHWRNYNYNPYHTRNVKTNNQKKRKGKKSAYVRIKLRPR